MLKALTNDNVQECCLLAPIDNGRCSLAIRDLPHVGSGVYQDSHAHNAHPVNLAKYVRSFGGVHTSKLQRSDFGVFFIAAAFVCTIG